jgi:DNA helicase-2/ATP-dependent DNA helicase PcrA
MNETTFTPRPKQKELLDTYLARRGKMGVSAVPGSGKTHTLSYLAAQLVASGLADDQEVLIVTLVNSAVDNFRSRIAGFIKRGGLLPGLGYRVRTLHGLAHDIVRLRPGLVGLADDFVIVDERETDHILEEVVTHWLRDRSYALDEYLAWGELSDDKADWVRRNQWPELALDLARAFVKRAKDWRLTPEALAERLAQAETAGRVPLQLAAMATAVYRDYQLALTYRGGVDFDDLIRLAYQALVADPDFLARLRHQWPFILEDEAQDSSKLQEDILRLLAGHPEGNWVRCGDPNQAVYHTFTNASPQYLRDFLRAEGVDARELPNSGRSQMSVIRLANYLIDWSRADHPVAELRGALMPPHIEPAPPGDPQPNPADMPSQIRLVAERYTPEAEVIDIVRSVQRWLAEHPTETVAVLTPRNKKGVDVVNALRQAKVPHVELLNSTAATRSTSGVLGNVLRHLSEPTSARQLATLFHAWRRGEWDDPDQRVRLRAIETWLRKLRRVEDFLWPLGEKDLTPAPWSQQQGPLRRPERGGEHISPFPNREGGQEVRSDAEEPGILDDAEARALLDDFRQVVRHWQGAAALPVDQLLLALGQDLFTEPTDLALTHKLAVELRNRQDLNPDWRLPELTEELAVIARNQRRFLGFEDADTGFQPPAGAVTVATMHRAKGLEWDRVYLTSVNNYDFPSAQPHDSFISEKWFVRDQLNLEAEALAQLKALSDGNPAAYVEGGATLQARIDYAAERLRLLYVGITRAKKELIITWNSGRTQAGRLPMQQATPLIALTTWWEEQGGSRQ